MLTLCHPLKQSGNKLSGRCSLLTPTLPPEEGKRRKRERDLQIEYKNFTKNINNTNNINNKRNNAKYTKLTLSFLELVPGRWCPASSCQAAPGSPRLNPAVDETWTQECMDRDLDQDHMQNNEQGPPQKAAMDEESETLVIPQLYTEYDVHGMEYLTGQYQVTCPVRPSLNVLPLPTPHLWDLRDLLVTLAAIVIIINRGLFLHSFPAVSSSVTINIRCYQLWSGQCL